MRSEQLKIVIPSYKRADRVITKRVLEDPIICVAESEKEEYMKYNPDCEIVTHPDTIKGLIPKRNWMIKHFGDIFMVDDDIESVIRMKVEKGESAKMTVEEVMDNIHQLYDLAKTMGISLFGFGNITTPVRYNEFVVFNLNKPITGCAYGVIPSANTKWDESFVLKEDFLISSTIMYTERRILTREDIHFTQKDTSVNPGGLSKYRDKETAKRNVLMLRKYFGESIRLKGKGFGNEKEEYNIVMRYRI